MHVTILGSWCKPRRDGVPVPGDKRSVSCPDKPQPDGDVRCCSLARPIPTIPEHLMTWHAFDGHRRASACVSECSNGVIGYPHQVDRGSRPSALVTSDDGSGGSHVDVSRRHRVDGSSGQFWVVGGKPPLTASMAEDTVRVHVERILAQSRVRPQTRSSIATSPPRIGIRSNASSACFLCTQPDRSRWYAVRHEAAIHLVDVLTTLTTASVASRSCDGVCRTGVIHHAARTRLVRINSPTRTSELHRPVSL